MTHNRIMDYDYECAYIDWYVVHIRIAYCNNVTKPILQCEKMVITCDRLIVTYADGQDLNE